MKGSSVLFGAERERYEPIVLEWVLELELELELVLVLLRNLRKQAPTMLNCPIFLEY